MARADDRHRDRPPLPDDAQDPAFPLRTAGPGTNSTVLPAGGEDDQEIWLLSYSDLVTLLLSVFVMLLAITTLKDQLPTTPQPDLPAVAAHTVPPPLPLFDEPDADASPDAPPTGPAPPPDQRQRLDGERLDGPRLDDGQVAVAAPDRVASQWRETLAALGVPRSVAVDVRQNRVGIVIGEGILFASGQAELTPGGDGLLRRLAPMLAGTRGDIVVEGHTDPTPISNRRYPSNWELSAGRAAGVVRRLIELGLPPERLSAVGFADTRPLADGSDPAARARNRRVAITLQADGLPAKGPAAAPEREPSRANP